MADEVELVASLAATFVANGLVMRRVLAHQAHSDPRRLKVGLKPAVPFRRGLTSSGDSAQRLEGA